MIDIIYDDDGHIDWIANGWPEPNAEESMNDGERSTEDMPDDIFEIWLEECRWAEDNGWEVDW